SPISVPLISLLFFSRLLRPPSSTLFPYTTLFRSGPSCAWPRPRSRANSTSRARRDPRYGRRAGAQTSVESVLDVGEARRIGCARSEEHTSELQSQSNLVCRLLLEKKKKKIKKQQKEKKRKIYKKKEVRLQIKLRER